MVTHPEHLVDFYAWLAVVVFFSAFTKNVQETTNFLGKKLFGNETCTAGVQDAITPSWQTRNNIIMFVFLVVFLGVSMYVFKWYVGTLIFIATFFLAIPLVSRVLMFPANSIFIVNKIKNNLINRKQTYEEAGDLLRATAVSEVLEKLKEITNS